MSSLSRPPIDIPGMMASVFREFGFRCKLLSVTPNVHRDGSWAVKYQQLQPREDRQITVLCAPGSSPFDVRRSVRRQLGLE